MNNKKTKNTHFLDDGTIEFYNTYFSRNPELNQIITELWKEYKKAVKEHGYGKESKEVLVKIYSFAPKG